jgi:AcrR family transcriptional regulator
VRVRVREGRNRPDRLDGRPGRVVGVAVRDRVLDALQDLLLAGGSPPSLDAVAAAAGVSKGGLLHHFPDRRALAHALVRRVLDTTDAAMAEAAARGEAAATWLRLSAAQGSAARALLALSRVTAAGVDLPVEVAASVGRWQRMISDELGDPLRGEAVRLVGDGLLAEALSGPPPAAERVEALVAHLVGER